MPENFQHVVCGRCGENKSECVCADVVRALHVDTGGGRPELQNKIIACAGRKGSGKSTVARVVLEHCVRLFCFDTMGEHLWIPDRFDELDKATIYLMETHTYDSFMGSLVPESDDEDKEFSEICATVYDQGNMMFAIEEVVMLGCSPNFAPKKFKRLMRLGRHRNVDMLYTTQRIGECPRALTAATDVFILFAHSEPRDLDAIAERCGAEIARVVGSFKGHEFLIWDVNAKQRIKTLDPVSLLALGSQMRLSGGVENGR